MDETQKKKGWKRNSSKERTARKRVHLLGRKRERKENSKSKQSKKMMKREIMRKQGNVRIKGKQNK